jgi:hypothetical protein
VISLDFSCSFGESRDVMRAIACSLPLQRSREAAFQELPDAAASLCCAVSASFCSIGRHGAKNVVPV